MALTATSLEQLRSGNENGLRDFMGAYSSSLRFVAYKITRDKELAEEIVSDSYFKLWANRKRIASIHHARSFLYLVTRRACYDQTSTSVWQPMSNPQEILEQQTDDADIQAQIEYTELIQKVAIEINKLPKQQAEIFRMTFIEGEETADICKKLNTTVNNVYFARSKALARLREVFTKKDISLYTLWVVLVWIPLCATVQKSYGNRY